MQRSSRYTLSTNDKEFSVSSLNDVLSITALGAGSELESAVSGGDL